VTVEDARQIMSEEKLLRYSDTGAVQLGANFFRYALLSKGVGYWVDMDFYFLKRFEFGDSYVFGWEYENWINNAVLRAPADAPIVRDLMVIPATNRRPPRFGPKRTLHYYWSRLRKGDIRVQDFLGAPIALEWQLTWLKNIVCSMPRNRLTSFTQ
jgi:hypothetical protein